MDKLIKRYFPSVIFAGVWCVLIFLFSVLSYYMNFTDETLKAASYIITILCILLSAVSSGRRSDKLGWANGMITGGIFIFIIIMIGFLIGARPETGGIAVKMPIYIFSSFIGGIMGINMK